MAGLWFWEKEIFRGITGMNPERVSDEQEGEVAPVSIQAHHAALEHQLDHTGQYQKCIIINGITSGHGSAP